VKEGKISKEKKKSPMTITSHPTQPKANKKRGPGDFKPGHKTLRAQGTYIILIEKRDISPASRGPTGISEVWQGKN